MNVLEAYHQISNTPPSPQAINYEKVMSGCGSAKYGDHEKEFIKINFLADVINVARRFLSVSEFTLFKRYYLDTDSNLATIPDYMLEIVSTVGTAFRVCRLYPMHRYLT